MTNRKFYKKTIVIEVLSEEPYSFGNVEELGWDMAGGNISGQIVKEIDVELDGKQVAHALLDQASDPEFFGVDAEGNDI
jgi:hypothetical protein